MITGSPSPDPFGTDTEIDSEEDEKNQSPSKVLICKDEEHSEDEEAFCSLPKRSRRNKVNDTTQPSTSGTKTQNNKTTKSTTKSPKTDCKETTALPKRRGRKSKKDSCVLGKFEMDAEEEELKEDAFNFPNKSKPTKLSRKEVQPSSKDIEFNIKEEPKEEIDSDRTPSGIEVLSLTKLAQEPKTFEDKTEVTDHKVPLSTKPADCRKEEVDQSFKAFSSSTLDLLNNLI